MAAFARRRRSFAMLMLLLLLEEDDDLLYHYLNDVYYGNTEEGSDSDSEEEDDEDEGEMDEDVDTDTADDEHGFDEDSENEGDDEAEVEPKENHEVVWKLFYLWIQSVVKTSSVNQEPLVAKGRKKSTAEKCQNGKLLKSGRIVEEELFFFLLTFLYRIFPPVLIFSSPLFLLLAL